MGTIHFTVLGWTVTVTITITRKNGLERFYRELLRSGKPLVIGV